MSISSAFEPIEQGDMINESGGDDSSLSSFVREAYSASTYILPPGQRPELDLGSIKLPETELLAVEPDGFRQDAPEDECSSGFERVVDKLKGGLFGEKESLHDRIEERVIDELSPEDREAYEQEQRALKEHYRKMITRMTINPELTELPETPVHDRVREQVRQVKEDIREKIRENMSPSDRERLDRQMDEYSDAMSDYYANRNPLGTGDWGQFKPQPGNAVEDYFDKIREATMEYVSQGDCSTTS